QNMDETYREAIQEKEKLIEQLEQKVKKLKLKDPDLKLLTEGLERLKIPTFNFEDYNLPDLSFTNSVKLSEIAVLLEERTKNIKMPHLSNIANLDPQPTNKVKSTKASPKKK